MRTHFLYLIVLLFAWSIDLDAQKLHYSYYQFAPLDVNPANSGAFSGSYRVSGIYTKKGFQIAYSVQLDAMQTKLKFGN